MFCDICPAGPHPVGAAVSDRNELPVEPPVISTVPLFSSVAVAALRAVVIWPPLPAPATVNLLVVSSYSSAVLSASHSKPENDDDPQAGPPLAAFIVLAKQCEPPTTRILLLGSTTAGADASREPFKGPTVMNMSARAS